ncbi:MAG TPA: DNA polymerase/3'-5' exonuclease PolX [Balneolales bacterium]|nr:DNA polymerase/3'-5' exonuclease PolX [Balneolales bacterium]
MALTNQQVATKLEEIGTLMRLAGENEFRARAFDNAARTIESLHDDISTYIKDRSLTKIKGIGKSIAEDIYNLAETGSIPVLVDLHKRVPEELIKWLDISGMGPKKVYKIHKELNITTIDELKEKVKDGSVAKLSGLGEKSAEKIMKSIEWMEKFSERCLISEAMEIAEPMYGFMKKQKGVESIDIAGSLRRRLETIGDIDILVGAQSEHVSKLFDAFTGHELVTEILGRGETKSSIRTESGRQVDLRVVKPEQFPAALMYFTGSKEHNVVLRQRARERGMSLNEYGLFKLSEKGDTDFDQPVSYTSEEDIYKKLDLHFIPPELREDMGEFRFFEKNEKADLVEENQLRGILHAHSTWSDGKFSIREMAEACIERGYEYLGLTDHSKTAAYAGGLTVDDLKRQWDEVDKLNEEYAKRDKPFRILKGTESDILSDGSLDYPDDILEQFELVVASVHASLDMPREKMMDRFRNAIKNPFTRIVGHPTTRLLLRRGASDMDMNELIELAAEHDTAIEVNANPHRLDLDWRHGRKAKEVGMMSAICPDAHTIDGLDDVRYGVYIARKGWFGPDRILNTKSVDDLLAWLKDRN